MIFTSIKHAILTKILACLLILSFSLSNTAYAYDINDNLRTIRAIETMNPALMTALDGLRIIPVDGNEWLENLLRGSGAQAVRISGPSGNILVKEDIVNDRRKLARAIKEAVDLKVALKRIMSDEGTIQPQGKGIVPTQPVKRTDLATIEPEKIIGTPLSALRYMVEHGHFEGNEITVPQLMERISGRPLRERTVRYEISPSEGLQAVGLVSRNENGYFVTVRMTPEQLKEICRIPELNHKKIKTEFPRRLILRIEAILGTELRSPIVPLEKFTLDVSLDVIAQRIAIRAVELSERDQLTSREMGNIFWALLLEDMPEDDSGNKRLFTDEEIYFIIKQVNQRLVGMGFCADESLSYMGGVDPIYKFREELIYNMRSLLLDLESQKVLIGNLKRLFSALSLRDDEFPVFLARDALAGAEFYNYMGLVTERDQNFGIVYQPGMNKSAIVSDYVSDKGVERVIKATEEAKARAIGAIQRSGRIPRKTSDPFYQEFHQDVYGELAARFAQDMAQQWEKDPVLRREAEIVYRQMKTNGVLSHKNIVLIDMAATGKTLLYVKSVLEYFSKRHGDDIGTVRIFVGWSHDKKMCLPETRLFDPDFKESPRPFNDQNWPFYRIGRNETTGETIFAIHQNRYWALTHVYRSLYLYNAALAYAREYEGHATDRQGIDPVDKNLPSGRSLSDASLLIDSLFGAIDAADYDKAHEIAERIQQENPNVRVLVTKYRGDLEETVRKEEKERKIRFTSEELPNLCEAFHITGRGRIKATIVADEAIPNIHDHSGENVSNAKDVPVFGVYLIVYEHILDGTPTLYFIAKDNGAGTSVSAIREMVNRCAHEGLNELHHRGIFLTKEFCVVGNKDTASIVNIESQGDRLTFTAENPDGVVEESVSDKKGYYLYVRTGLAEKDSGATDRQGIDPEDVTTRKLSGERSASIVYDQDILRLFPEDVITRIERIVSEFPKKWQDGDYDESDATEKSGRSVKIILEKPIVINGEEVDIIDISGVLFTEENLGQEWLGRYVAGKHKHVYDLSPEEIDENKMFHNFDEDGRPILAEPEYEQLGGLDADEAEAKFFNSKIALPQAGLRGPIAVGWAEYDKFSSKHGKKLGVFISGSRKRIKERFGTMKKSILTEFGEKSTLIAEELDRKSNQDASMAAMKSGEMVMAEWHDPKPAIRELYKGYDFVTMYRAYGRAVRRIVDAGFYPKDPHDNNMWIDLTGEEDPIYYDVGTWKLAKDLTWAQRLAYRYWALMYGLLVVLRDLRGRGLSFAYLSDCVEPIHEYLKGYFYDVAEDRDFNVKELIFDEGGRSSLEYLLVNTTNTEPVPERTDAPFRALIFAQEGLNAPEEDRATDRQGIDPEDATGTQLAVEDAEAAVDLMIGRLKGMREDEDVHWKITYDTNRLSLNQREIIEKTYRTITGLGNDRLKIVGNNRRADKDDPLISVECWRRGSGKLLGEGHVRVPIDRDISQLRVLNALNIAMALASASKDLTAQEIRNHRLMGFIESQHLAITGKPFDPSNALLDIRTVILRDLPQIKPEELDDYERAMEAVLRAV